MRGLDARACYADRMHLPSARKGIALSKKLGTLAPIALAIALAAAACSGTEDDASATRPTPT